MPDYLLAALNSLGKGWATLAAASLAALVSLVSLVVAIIASRSQSKLVARLSDSTNLSKEAREYKLKQLASLYDPLYTLLAANKSIFDRIGPTSSARRAGEFNDNETAEVWHKLSNEVVVRNNERICEIIQENLHYSAEADDEAIYLDFLTHAQAYKVFKQGAYEAYRLFPFPKPFFESVRGARAALRSEISTTYRSKK